MGQKIKKTILDNGTEIVTFVDDDESATMPVEEDEEGEDNE